MENPRYETSCQSVSQKCFHSAGVRRAVGTYSTPVDSSRPYAVNASSVTRGYSVLPAVTTHKCVTQVSASSAFLITNNCGAHLILDTEVLTALSGSTKVWG